MGAFRSMRAAAALVLGVTMAGVSPQRGDALARLGDALPRSDDALPRSDDALPRSDDALPRSDDALPRSGDALLRSDDALPRSGVLRPGDASPPGVRPSPNDREAEALFFEGQRAEDEGDFSRALERDDACMTLAPTTRWADEASKRAAWIRARSEGAFLPLARLEQVRRDPAAANSPSAIASLGRDAETFPPGRVRAEARMMAAEAWLGRLHRPELAVPLLRAVADDRAADDALARWADNELVGLWIAQGSIDLAVRELRDRGAILDDALRRRIARLARRRTIRAVAFAVLAFFATLVAAAIARAAQRGALASIARALRATWVTVAAFATYVAVMGGGLAARYEYGRAAPFLRLAAATVPILLMARCWSAVGTPSLRGRTLRAVLAASSVIAVAFMVLDTLDPTYLEGFGL